MTRPDLDAIEARAKDARDCHKRGCHEPSLVIHVDKLDPELVEQLTAALDRDKVRRFV